jgi:glutamate-5-semialdehyde dehydrogenase
VETREDVNALLRLDEYIDLVIPRGSNQLVRSIQRASSIPVMGHADGLCCAYVHEDAEASSTVANLVDAKIDYPAACNAVETILIHSAQLRNEGLLPEIVKALVAAKVTLHMDDRSMASATATFGQSEFIRPASAVDFDTEYLSLDVAVKAVDNLDEAITHINEHGSHHTDVIFTAAKNKMASAAAEFVRAIDSANVYVNASTRFADGFRYGFGTEVGISTGKIHARGPVGLEGLVTYKYIGQGHGGRQVCADFGTERQFTHSEQTQEYPSL